MPPPQHFKFPHVRRRLRLSGSPHPPSPLVFLERDGPNHSGKSLGKTRSWGFSPPRTDAGQRRGPSHRSMSSACRAHLTEEAARGNQSIPTSPPPRPTALPAPKRGPRMSRSPCLFSCRESPQLTASASGREGTSLCVEPCHNLDAGRPSHHLVVVGGPSRSENLVPARVPCPPCPTEGT